MNAKELMLVLGTSLVENRHGNSVAGKIETIKGVISRLQPLLSELEVEMSLAKSRNFEIQTNNA